MGRRKGRPSPMLRFVVLLLAIIFVLTILRTIISVVKATLRELTSGGKPGPKSGGASEPKVIGELKKDPVCGTYISTDTKFTKTVKGEVVYFCSAACRDKYE
jgi:YHS domain-containing protein